MIYIIYSSQEYVFKANEKVYIGFTNEDSPLNVDVRKCIATPDISTLPSPPGLNNSKMT